MRSGSNVAGYLGQVGTHRRRVDDRRDQPCRSATRRADRAKEVRPLIAGVAGCAGPAATPGPDAGEGSLLTHPGVRRENSPPDCFLARLTPGTRSPAARPVPAPCPLRDRGGYRFGEVFLNAACACGSGFGCCGRNDRRRKPSAASCLPTLRSCNATPDAVAMRCCKSLRRQGTTPSRSGSGPASTQGRKFGQLLGCEPPGPVRHRPVHQPGEPRGVVAVHPVARAVWRSIPQVAAAVARPTPASTSAITSIRRAARASFVRPAAARNSAAVRSLRVIATLPCPPPSRVDALSQSSNALGIPNESREGAVGIIPRAL